MKRRDNFFAGLTFALLLALAWVVMVEPALTNAGWLPGDVVTETPEQPAASVTTETVYVDSDLEPVTVHEETVFVVTSTPFVQPSPSPTAPPAPTNTAVSLAIEYAPQFLADCAFAQNTPGRRAYPNCPPNAAERLGTGR